VRWSQDPDSAWCDQIPTLAKNLLGPYSGHLCAYWHPHDSGKLLANENPELLMSIIIPLEFQRKYEKRWAARFRQPVSTAPKRQSDGTHSVLNFKSAERVNKGKAGYVIDLTTGGVSLAEGEEQARPVAATHYRNHSSTD
jgi:hypothetical protein